MIHISGHTEGGRLSDCHSEILGLAPLLKIPRCLQHFSGQVVGNPT